MLRTLFVGISICLVALFGVAPASAHGHGHATHAAKAASTPAPQSAKPATRHFPCETQRVTAREVIHHYHSHAPDHPHHNDANHDPSDHSHPPGEDFVVHVMLHISLDFAPLAEWGPALSQAQDGSLITRRQDSGAGITVLPPVPPPLV